MVSGYPIIDQTARFSDSIRGAIKVTDGDDEYVFVPASTTLQSLGNPGTTGNYLKRLIVIPTTTSPGVVQVKDGAETAVTMFAGGATSVADLKPFEIPFGHPSRTGAWQITTGANVSVWAAGLFNNIMVSEDAVFAPYQNYDIALPGGLAPYTSDVFNRMRRFDIGYGKPIVWPDGACGIATTQHSGITNTSETMEGTYPNGEATHWELTDKGFRFCYNSMEPTTSGACRSQGSFYPQPVGWATIDMWVQFGDATTPWTLTTTGVSPNVFWQMKPLNFAPTITLEVDTDELDTSKLKIRLIQRVTLGGATTVLKTVSGLSRHTMIHCEIEGNWQYTNALGSIAFRCNNEPSYNHDAKNLFASDATSYHQQIFGIYQYLDLVPTAFDRAIYFRRLQTRIPNYKRMGVPK